MRRNFGFPKNSAHTRHLPEARTLRIVEAERNVVLEAQVDSPSCDLNKTIRPMDFLCVFAGELRPSGRVLARAKRGTPGLGKRLAGWGKVDHGSAGMPDVPKQTPLNVRLHRVKVTTMHEVPWVDCNSVTRYSL